MLELNTARERNGVKIDGVVYEMVEIDDLSLKDVAWLDKAGKRLKAAAATIEKGEAEQQMLEETSSLLREFVALLLPKLPPEVLARLSDVKMLMIANAYMEGRGTGPFVARPEALQEETTGSASSPVSSGSTGEASSPG